MTRDSTWIHIHVDPFTHTHTVVAETTIQLAFYTTGVVAIHTYTHKLIVSGAVWSLISGTRTLDMLSRNYTLPSSHLTSSTCYTECTHNKTDSTVKTAFDLNEVQTNVYLTDGPQFVATELHTFTQTCQTLGLWAYNWIWPISYFYQY